MFRQLANLFSSRIAPTSLADDLESLKREREDHRIGSQTIPAAELLRRHPPQPEHAKKQLLFDTVLEGDTGLSGPVSASRYREIQVPANYQPFDTNTEVVVSEHGGLLSGRSNNTEYLFCNRDVNGCGTECDALGFAIIQIPSMAERGSFGLNGFDISAWRFLPLAGRRVLRPGQRPADVGVSEAGKGVG